MSHSALDILDEDPLGLFKDEKRQGRTQRPRHRRNRDIFEGIEFESEKDGRETELNVGLEHLSFLKSDRREPPKKGVTFEERSKSAFDSTINDLRASGDSEKENCSSTPSNLALPETTSTAAQVSRASHKEDTEFSEFQLKLEEEFQNLGIRQSSFTAAEEDGVVLEIKSNFRDQNENNMYNQAVSDFMYTNDVDASPNKSDQPTDVFHSIVTTTLKESPPQLELENISKILPKATQPQKVLQLQNVTKARANTFHLPGARVESIRLGEPPLQLMDDSNPELPTSYNAPDQESKKTSTHSATPRRQWSAERVRIRPTSCHTIRMGGAPAKANEGDTDANVVRQMAYREWLSKHRRTSKADINNQKNEANDMVYQQKQLEKIHANQKVFLSWQEHKKPILRELAKKRKESEAIQQRKLMEQREKRKASEKAFEVWKVKKEATLKRQLKEEQQKLRTALSSKKEVEVEKRHLSERSYEYWKAKKDADFKEHQRRIKRMREAEERRRADEAKSRAELAAEAFYIWELKKSASMDFVQSMMTEVASNDRRAWRPPSCSSKR